jgi:hypothetical protein
METSAIQGSQARSSSSLTKQLEQRRGADGVILLVSWVSNDLSLHEIPSLQASLVCSRHFHRRIIIDMSRISTYLRSSHCVYFLLIQSRKC